MNLHIFIIKNQIFISSPYAYQVIWMYIFCIHIVHLHIVYMACLSFMHNDEAWVCEAN